MPEDIDGAMVTAKALYAALAKFQASMADVRIVKEKTARIGDEYEYRYADLGSIVSAMRKPMGDAGLSFSQAITAESDGRTVLRTRIYHTEGGYIESVMTLPVGNMKPRDIGSLLTYYRRYTLTALAGVVAEDDDDGAMAQVAGYANVPVMPVQPQMGQSEREKAIQEVLDDINRQTTFDDIKKAFAKGAELAHRLSDKSLHEKFKKTAADRWTHLKSQASEKQDFVQ